MRTLLSRNNRRITDKRIMDTRIRHQVRLEFVEIHIQRAIKTQTGSDRADNLRNQTIQMLMVRTRDIQATLANVVHSLVIDQERAIRVLDRAVRGQDRVVGFDDGGRGAGSRVDGKFEFALLAVVGVQALEEEGAETGTSATTEGVEDKKALERGAVVCHY